MVVFSPAITGGIFPEGISAAGLALRGLVKFAKQNMANTADARVAIFRMVWSCIAFKASQLL